MSRRRRRSDSGRDEGAASIWVLSVAMALLALATATASVASAIAVRHRVETAADLAALAAATMQRDGGDACSAAARIAAANRATLVRCEVAADATVLVGVSAPLPWGVARWAAGDARASARAGW